MTTIGETCVLADPKHYVWWFPGSPVKVHLDLQVVQRLREQINGERGVPQEGLLFGKTLEGAVEILDFQPVFNSNVAVLVAALPNDRKLALVGYYRTEPGEALRLNDNDRSLVELCFEKPSHVVLMIQTAGFDPPNATFFFHDGGGRSVTDFAFLEFPFDPSQLAIEESDRIQRSQQATAEQPITAPPPGTADRPKKRGLLKLAAWSFLGVLVLATGMLIGTRFFQERSFRPSNGISHPPTVEQPIPLGLEAERQNGDLKLTWNRQAPTVLSATSGVLSIEDGDSHRKIILDSAHIRNGSILYAPITVQIQIQLTLNGPQETTSESVLVLLPEGGIPQVKTLTRQEKPVGLAQHLANKPFTPPAEPLHIETAGSPAPVNDPPDLGIGKADSGAIPQLLAQPVAPPQPTTSQPQPPPPTDPQTKASFELSPIPSALPVYPPVVVSSVLAVYPPALRSLGLKIKTVEIKVSIDETGRAVKAEPLEGKGWVPQSMVQAAIEAARRYKFKPARRGNQAIPGEMILQFNFKPTQ